MAEETNSKVLALGRGLFGHLIVIIKNVLPIFSIDNMPEGPMAKMIFASQCRCRFPMLLTASDGAHIVVRQMRIIAMLTTRQCIWAGPTSIPISSGIPLFGMAVRRIVLGCSLEKMAITPTHNAVDGIPSFRFGTATRRIVTGMQSKDFRGKDIAQSELKCHPMGSCHLKGTFRSTSYAYLAIASLRKFAGPRPTAIRRGVAVDVAL